MKTIRIFFLLYLVGTSVLSAQPQKKTSGGVATKTASPEVSSNGMQSQQNQTDLLKLPLKIVKITPSDTLTITFEYDDKNEIKQVKSITTKGYKTTISFRYLNSIILRTLVTSTSEEKTTDTLYISNGLITKDEYYKYVYENKKLVEIKSLSRIGDSYSIQYDNIGNAIEMTRIIPPMTKDDETVTQIAQYQYDLTLKNKFFFSTDIWFLSLNGDDAYDIPTSKLFGLVSANLVKEVKNDRRDYTYRYKYLSFDESGYPTHYTITETDNYYNKSLIIADYTISYIVPVNVVNGKWSCVDKNMKQLIADKFDTATYKDFSFDGKVISCTKLGIMISMDAAGNMLSLKTNAGKSYNTICDAINGGDVEAIKKFIDFGVDLNIQYKYRYKDQWNDQMKDGYPIDLLMRIETKNDGVRKNITELLSLFIEHGFNINNNSSFYTMTANVIRGDFSKDDKIKMLQILIDNNANVNEIGKNGNTPLMELCIMLTVFQHKCSDVYDISKFLIEHGANPTIKNAAGNSAKKMTKKSDCYELIELLNKKEK